MAAAAEEIARRLRSDSEVRRSPLLGQRIMEAIRRFRDKSGDLEFRTLRLVCHGCSQFLPHDCYVLLGEPEAMRLLLATVSGYEHEPRRYRRLYDGLLRSYLFTDRQAEWFSGPSVQEGNEQLRQYLDGAFSNIQALQPAPDWVRALSDHPHVLSTDPGRRFAQAWLSGDQSAFRDAVDRLGLSGSSWFAIEVLRSALHAAAAQNDRSFVRHIPAFLAAAAELRFQPIRDDIYVALVSRYAQQSSPAVHPELRDALIRAWKNPWLTRNESAWGRVPDAARAMVAGWLKLELIHQFFEVLSEDGRQDSSRFEFWQKYHRQIDDVYFALGGRAHNSGSADIVKLRRSLEGRLLRLQDTEADNNAFIMCIGANVFIEFSKKGNAAYRYRRRDFDIDGGTKNVRVTQLKRAPPGVQMRHAWAGGRSWQDNFAREIVGTPSRSQARYPTEPTSPRASVPDVGKFARSQGIPMEDRRAAGGSLWLRVDDSDPDIGRTLASWGFKYAQGKGWWRLGG
jgi:hypothetical protein